MELYDSQSGQQQLEWDGETGVEESVPNWNVWEREVYPERPGLPDCSYYMRTGSCGYGAKCRFNHPRDRSISLGGAEYPERIGEPACQHYLRTWKCKFGASCKYNHPKNAGGSLTNVPLNNYGYPLRPGEKECSYYLKTGQCKFGVTCKYHHPYPTAGTTTMPASARPFYPTVQNLSPSPSPEQYDGSNVSYGVGRPPMLPGTYVPGAYGPLLLHPGVVPVQNWNPYSGPISPAPSANAQPPAGGASVYGMSQLGSCSALAVSGGGYSQADGPSSGNAAKELQFPERPGQPDCKYYMRTGECKYGPSCRYNHPPNWAIPISTSALSPLGLPLRPGVQACSFYMQKGQCKFGITCKFDHPMANSNYIPAPSYTEMPGTCFAKFLPTFELPAEPQDDYRIKLLGAKHNF